MNNRVIMLTFVSVALLSALLSHRPTFRVPKDWPAPIYPITQQTLQGDLVDWGRVLFYDPILSRDSSTSCSSCHSVYHAFAHTDHALSHGIHDRIGIRNAPALMNLAWQPIFMWDGAVHHLDALPLAPITNPLEMDETPEHVLTKLRLSPRHQAFFQSLHPGEEMETKHYCQALSAFLITLISDQSKYDRMKRGEVLFSEQENRGYTLFQQQCAACHREPLFTNHAFASNGITAAADSGRSRITGLNSDRHLFKVPTLRNVEFSKPYMHDGRYQTLREVMRHYASLNHSSTYVSNNASQTSAPLSDQEQTDVIAFLLTLSDSAFVYNKDLAYPFELTQNKP
jgi:cytochrome c peroxidase